MQLTLGFLPPHAVPGRQVAHPVRRLRVKLPLCGPSTFHSRQVTLRFGDHAGQESC